MATDVRLRCPPDNLSMRTSARSLRPNSLITSSTRPRLAGINRGDAEAILGPDLAPLSPAQRAALADLALQVLDIRDATRPPEVDGQQRAGSGGSWTLRAG